jgi:hypothetical protein
MEAVTVQAGLLSEFPERRTAQTLVPRRKPPGSANGELQPPPRSIRHGAGTP